MIIRLSMSKDAAGSSPIASDELAYRGTEIYYGQSIYLTVSGISKRKHSEWNVLL